MVPNYVDSGGRLLRWEQFPVRVSIDRASLAIVGDGIGAYERGIREGAVVWGLATGGAIGQVDVGFDVPDAELVVRMRESDDDPDCVLFDVCRNGFVDANVVEFGRLLRRGTIVLVRDQIQRSATDLQPFIAKLVGHEMGHALGLFFHSEDPADLMYPRSNLAAAGRLYPWVSERDLNTIGTAYCR